MSPLDTKEECPMDPKRSYVIKKEKMEVIALTDYYRIEGLAHFIPQARISDFMNRTDIEFIPLTDAKISDRKSGEEIAYAKFLSLNKSDVTIMIPKSELG